MKKEEAKIVLILLGAALILLLGIYKELLQYLVMLKYLRGD